MVGLGVSVTTTKDGRTILDGRDYTRFRSELFQRQSGMCSNCPRKCCLTANHFMPHSFHVHHKHGRGMGGGKRDDTLEAVTGLCGNCHREVHGQ